MFKWIILEIKQMITNRKNIVVFIALILMHVIALSNFDSDADIMANKIKEYTFMAEMQNQSPSIYNEMYSVEEKEFNNRILKAISDNNIEEYNKIILIENLRDVNETERYLLNIEDPSHGKLPEKIDSYYLNHELHQELKKNIYEDFNYIDDGTGVKNDLSMYNSKVNHLQYNYETFNEDFILYNEPSKNSLTITLTLFRQYLMFIVVIVPLIVAFDTISNDKNDGSFRSIMALKQRRSKYFIVKLISVLIVSLFLIIIPLAIALLINNVNLIKDLKYPHYINSKGLHSFEAINPVLEFDQHAYRLDQYAYHSRAVFNFNEYGFIIGVHDGIELYTLGHLLGYSLILISFTILFILSLQLALSINTNKFIGFIITLTIIAVLFRLTKNINLVSSKTQFLQHVPLLKEKINPLNYLNAVDVVEGTTPFTFISGITFLTTYTVIISALSCAIFKQKDITD